MVYITSDVLTYSPEQHIMPLSLIEGALGGIGLFLLGMRLLSDGIRTLTDVRIRRFCGRAHDLNCVQTPLRFLAKHRINQLPSLHLAAHQ